MVVHALAHTEHRDELVGILQAGTSDPALLARSVELFEEAGSIEYARSYSLELTAAAKKSLEDIELDEHCHSLFMSMADFFIDRLN